MSASLYRIQPCYEIFYFKFTGVGISTRQTNFFIGWILGHYTLATGLLEKPLDDSYRIHFKIEKLIP